MVKDGNLITLILIGAILFLTTYIVCVETINGKKQEKTNNLQLHQIIVPERPATWEELQEIPLKGDLPADLAEYDALEYFHDYGTDGHRNENTMAFQKLMLAEYKRMEDAYSS